MFSVSKCPTACMPLVPKAFPRTLLLGARAVRRKIFQLPLCGLVWLGACSVSGRGGLN